MKPSIGRIVHYFPNSVDDEPIAAIVTKVWNDSDFVDLTVFMPNQQPEMVSTVGQTNPFRAGDCWDWPKRES